MYVTRRASPLRMYGPTSLQGMSGQLQAFRTPVQFEYVWRNRRKAAGGPCAHVAAEIGQGYRRERDQVCDEGVGIAGDGAAATVTMTSGTSSLRVSHHGS
jgi:hypothetical protein